MTSAVTALTPPPRQPIAGETAAIVAPRSDDTSYAHTLRRRGMRSVAVLLPPQPRSTRHHGHHGANPAGPYTTHVTHTAGLRRTVKQLRTLDVRAILAGSDHGIELAEQIARKLGLPGCPPETAHLRYDRGAQAQALRAAGLDAPRGLRTASLREALQWWDVSGLPRCELLPAATGTPLDPVVCRSRSDVTTAWTHMRHAADRFADDPHLVVREHLAGRQYVVNTVTHPGIDAPPHHLITDVWAQTNTPKNWPARLDLLRQNATGLLSRALSLYTTRALKTLHVACGPVCLRLVHAEGRGPLLLSAQAVAHSSPADYALRASTGADRMGDALDSVLLARPSRPTPAPNGHHVVRIFLHAPRGGTLHPALLRTLAALPAVVGADDQLTPLSKVPVTTGPSTVAGEIVLSSDSRDDIEAAYRVVRALETTGLYEGGRR